MKTIELTPEEAKTVYLLLDLYDLASEETLDNHEFACQCKLCKTILQVGYCNYETFKSVSDKTKPEKP